MLLSRIRSASGRSVLRGCRRRGRGHHGKYQDGYGDDEHARSPCCAQRRISAAERSGVRRNGHGCLGRPVRGALHFIQPGKPTQNACIESFNGMFRDECLNEHWFLTLLKAQVVIEAWRKEYNEERTHSTIGNLTPMEFINHHQNRPQAAQELTSLAVV